MTADKAKIKTFIRLYNTQSKKAFEVNSYIFIYLSNEYNNIFYL